MAFNDLELAANHAALKWFMAQRRPPEHIRKELDFGYAITGHDVELFEVRPQWDDPDFTTHRPFARVKFVRSADEWRLYWMRADLKWHRYPPSPTHPDLQQALSVVAEDANCCFFG